MPRAPRRLLQARHKIRTPSSRLPPRARGLRWSRVRSRSVPHAAHRAPCRTRSDSRRHSYVRSSRLTSHAAHHPPRLGDRVERPQPGHITRRAGRGSGLRRRIVLEGREHVHQHGQDRSSACDGRPTPHVGTDPAGSRRHYVGQGRLDEGAPGPGQGSLPSCTGHRVFLLLGFLGRGDRAGDRRRRPPSPAASSEAGPEEPPDPPSSERRSSVTTARAAGTSGNSASNERSSGPKQTWAAYEAREAYHPQQSVQWCQGGSTTSPHTVQTPSIVIQCAGPAEPGTTPRT